MIINNASWDYWRQMKWISATVLWTVNMLNSVQIWSPVGSLSFLVAALMVLATNASLTLQSGQKSEIWVNYSVEIRAISSVICVLLNRSKFTSRSPQICSDKVSRSHFCCKKHHWHEPLPDPSSVAWRTSGDTRLPTTVIGQDILCLSKPFNIIIWTSLPFQVTVARSPSQAVPFKASSLALPPTGQSL